VLSSHVSSCEVLAPSLLKSATAARFPSARTALARTLSPSLAASRAASARGFRVLDGTAVKRSQSVLFSQRQQAIANDLLSTQVLAEEWRVV
jgi:hypothetical protein